MFLFILRNLLLRNGFEAPALKGDSSITDHLALINFFQSESILIFHFNYAVWLAVACLVIRAFGCDHPFIRAPP